MKTKDWLFTAIALTSLIMFPDDQLDILLGQLREVSPNFLVVPEYRKNVDITEQQFDELLNFRTSVIDELQRLSEQAEETSANGREGLCMRIQASIDRFRGQLKEILDVSQVRRIDQLGAQIRYRTASDSSFGLIRMKDVLELSDGQLKDIENGISDAELATAKALVESHTKLRDVVREVMKELGEALTPTQQKKWIELVGDGFEKRAVSLGALFENPTENHQPASKRIGVLEQNRDFIEELRSEGVESHAVDMELFDEQKTQVRQLAKLIDERMWEFGSEFCASEIGIAELSTEFLENAKSDLRSEVESLRTQLDNCLNPQQRVKLKQIALIEKLKPSFENGFGILDLDLELSDSTRSKLEELVDDHVERYSDLRTRAKKELAEARSGALGVLSLGLSPSQQSRYSEFIGDEFLSERAVYSLITISSKPETANRLKSKVSE